MPWATYPLMQYGEETWGVAPPADAVHGLARLMQTEQPLVGMDTYYVPEDQLEAFGGPDNVPEPQGDAQHGMEGLQSHDTDHPMEDFSSIIEFMGPGTDKSLSFQFCGFTIQVRGGVIIEEPGDQPSQSSAPGHNTAGQPLRLYAPQSHLIPTTVQGGSALDSASSPLPTHQPQVPTQPPQAGAPEADSQGTLAQPTAVFHFAQVIRSLTDGTVTAGTPPRHRFARELPPPAGSSGAYDLPQAVPQSFLRQHFLCLAGASYRAKLLSVAVTSIDVEAASEFILLNPPDSLATHLDALVEGYIRAEVHELGCHVDSVTAYAKRKAGLLLANDPDIREQIHVEKRRLGSYLERMFYFVIEDIFDKKDSEIFKLKQQTNAAKLKATINSGLSIFCQAHALFGVPFNKVGLPITIHTHEEVDDFETQYVISRQVQIARCFHHHEAFKRIQERSFPSRQAVRPFHPTAHQRELMQTHPTYRTVAGQLRLISEDQRWEYYYLNYQAGCSLHTLRFSVEYLHTDSLATIGSSIIRRFYDEQISIEAFSPKDQVWRLVSLPIAMLSAGLYAIRENAELYLSSGLTGADALKLSPNCVVIFQAKILAVESATEKWLAKRPKEYLLFRHRALEIMADVIRPADPHIGSDLIGAAWISTQTDHMAYNKSYTSRQLQEPISLTPASLLAASPIASKRTLSQALNLFGRIKE